jgi:hypothetical protein
MLGNSNGCFVCLRVKSALGHGRHARFCALFDWSHQFVCELEQHRRYVFCTSSDRFTAPFKLFVVVCSVAVFGVFEEVVYTYIVQFFVVCG